MAATALQWQQAGGPWLAITRQYGADGALLALPSSAELVQHIRLDGRTESGITTQQQHLNPRSRARCNMALSADQRLGSTLVKASSKSTGNTPS